MIVNYWVPCFFFFCLLKSPCPSASFAPHRARARLHRCPPPASSSGAVRIIFLKRKSLVRRSQKSVLHVSSSFSAEEGNSKEGLLNSSESSSFGDAANITSASSTTAKDGIVAVTTTTTTTTTTTAQTPAPPVVETTIESPSVARILRFAVPAVGVWLCSPLLSLIDTSAVGLLSGTAQQAALNPAVAVTEYTALLIAFMYTGTTNLVASAQEKDRLGSVDDCDGKDKGSSRSGSGSKPHTSRNFIAALQLSGFVGAALGTILFGFSVPILRAIIGNDAIDPEVFSAALKYVRIRALGMPAAAIIGSAQAACLGMQDIKSPLYVLVAAAVVNFFGDVSFVGNSNPWIGGAAGAAWATIFSQYVAVFLFVRWLCHGGAPADPAARSGLPGKFRFLTNRFSKYSTRGFLEGKFRGRQFFHLPSRKKISDFAPYVLPVTSTQVGRVSSYVAMSHVISSSLGLANMAAQQVIISVWNCLYPVGESLSLTAQSLVPPIFEKQPSRARARALRLTLLNFWKAGIVFGVGLFGAVLCVPLLSPFFTADPVVRSLINTVVPFLLFIFLTLGIFTTSEGMLLGQRDLGFLGKSYASFFFIVPYLMLRVKKSAQSGTALVSLRSVWTVFTAYQLFRTVMWVLRAVLLQSRNES